MPISRGEFEAGRLNLAVPILQILEGNVDFAFTAREIANRLADIVERNATEAEVARELDELEQAGTVETQELGGQRWYIIKRRLVAS